ncbi:hypothetical protein L2D14_18370 [Thalassospiraceae bacterium LMO-JJ14]|nr:hypothetical protein L2D14_18370 [Thalassospiraceae bacterium LMO-JJ14]
MADKKPKIVNNPSAPEIYADRPASVSLRGNVARISLASERSGGDPKNPEAVVSGHLAMPVRGFVQLYAQMRSVIAQMEANGMIKATGQGDRQSKSKGAAKAAPARKKTPAKAKSGTSGKRAARKKS